MKAVSKAPAERYATAGEMLNALEACTEGAAVTVEMPSVPVAAGGYEVALKTNIGCVRSINQDACLNLSFEVFEKDVPTRAHLVVVADGMGGEAEGDKAASLAVRSLAREVLTSVLHFQIFGETNKLLPPDPIERARILLQRGLEVANRSIHDYSEQDSSRRGMGCTISCAMLLGDTAILGHVGDTRGYRFRGEELDLITTDHSLVGRLVQMGQMSREEARHSPQRSIIYRALGTNAEVEVDLYERRLAPGDYLLLCSDGVWEYYTDEELSECFSQGAECEDVADALIKICLERGADDNATCAVVRRLG
jgi:protein phosphatase